MLTGINGRDGGLFTIPLLVKFITVNTTNVISFGYIPLSYIIYIILPDNEFLFSVFLFILYNSLYLLY